MNNKITRTKVLRILKIILIVTIGCITFLSILGTVAHATGLVDDIISPSNEFSKYPQENYQLDFYVDNSWAWLPWNWASGIGKSVQYGLYAITNFVWTLSLYISNATGYVIQQAYKLDIIDDMADSVGKSMQSIAGITSAGITDKGFYGGLILLIIVVVGSYTAYIGLVKRETSKAFQSIVNFVVIFVLSASFIAYAPEYIKKINDFSREISTLALDVGTKILVGETDNEGKDSVDLIRESLFFIQVKQPWMLLQFGDSDITKLGVDRVNDLLSASPSENNGKKREDAIKTEINDKKNNNLTIPQVINRLGMVFFLLIFNIGISVFVFLLTAMMLFSQILFIIFAMFLPISFLLSMIPSFGNMTKSAIIKVFNTIMMRVGITLIVTIAFSISSMLYNMSGSYPFFMVAFLQIIVFAGIFYKLGDLMQMFNLNAGDSQHMGRRIFGQPYRGIRRQTRNMKRMMMSTGAGAIVGSAFTRNMNKSRTKQGKSSSDGNSFGSKAGAKAGAVMDAKNKFKDNVVKAKENISNVPTHASYAVHTARQKARGNISDFKSNAVNEKTERQKKRDDIINQKRETLAKKRAEMGLREHRTHEYENPIAKEPHESKNNTERKKPLEPRQNMKKRDESVKKQVVKDQSVNENTKRPATVPIQKLSSTNDEKLKDGTVKEERKVTPSTVRTYNGPTTSKSIKPTKFEKRTAKEMGEFITDSERKVQRKVQPHRKKGN